MQSFVDCVVSQLFCTSIACSVCPFGEYIQQSCTAQSNTVCAKCDVCPAMTFPSRFCTLGYNTICDTCEVCQFPDNEAKQYCEAQAPYKRWKEKHCCKDPHGRTVCLYLFFYAYYLLFTVTYT